MWRTSEMRGWAMTEPAGAAGAVGAAVAAAALGAVWSALYVCGGG